MAITALLPVFLFPMVGMMSVKETSKQYMNVSSVFPNFLFESAHEIMVFIT